MTRKSLGSLVVILGLMFFITAYEPKKVSWRAAHPDLAERGRENFRSEARDSGQNVLTDELPDRFEFELLRSTFESVDQRMNSPEQYFRFVGLSMQRSNTEMFCAAMIGLARHRREQKRAAGDRFQAGFGISQPHK